jgi:hypothetical protein
MLYLGIDQHRKRLTVNLRDASETVVLRHRESTRWEKLCRFLRNVQIPQFPYLDVNVTSLQFRAESRGCGDRRTKTGPHFR